MTAEEVAEELKVKPSWIREKARSDELVGFKTGKEWKFTRGSVDEFKAKLQKMPYVDMTSGRKRGAVRRSGMKNFLPRPGLVERGGGENG